MRSTRANIMILFTTPSWMVVCAAALTICVRWWQCVAVRPLGNDRATPPSTSHAGQTSTPARLRDDVGRRCHRQQHVQLDIGVEGEAPGWQHGCRLPRRSAAYPLSLLTIPAQPLLPHLPTLCQLLRQ